MGTRSPAGARLRSRPPTHPTLHPSLAVARFTRYDGSGSGRRYWVGGGGAGGSAGRSCRGAAVRRFGRELQRRWGLLLRCGASRQRTLWAGVGHSQAAGRPADAVPCLAGGCSAGACRDCQGEYYGCWADSDCCNSESALRGCRCHRHRWPCCCACCCCCSRVAHALAATRTTPLASPPGTAPRRLVLERRLPRVPG